mgnify:CR=1 FL=1
MATMFAFAETRGGTARKVAFEAVSAARRAAAPGRTAARGLPPRLDMNQMSWHESIFRAQLKPLSRY